MAFEEKNSEEAAPLYTDRSPSSERTSESEFDGVVIERLQKRSVWQRVRPWLFHLLLAAVYSTVFLVSISKKENIYSLIDSPAKWIGEKTHLEEWDLANGPNSQYTGPPRQEVDDAWREMLQYNNIRISEDWVHRYGREYQAVKVPGGGYLGMLGAFHELHCIKRLYRSLYPDYYFPNQTEKDIKINLKHNMHCLEVLRFAAQCHGDISIMSHMWSDKFGQPTVNQSSPHQCVDFQAVMDYAKDNAVDVFQRDYIIHPKYGKSPFNDMLQD